MKWQWWNMALIHMIILCPRHMYCWWTSNIKWSHLALLYTSRGVTSVICGYPRLLKLAPFWGILVRKCTTFGGILTRKYTPFVAKRGPCYEINTWNFLLYSRPLFSTKRDYNRDLIPLSFITPWQGSCDSSLPSCSSFLWTYIHIKLNHPYVKKSEIQQILFSNLGVCFWEKNLNSD